ncbi:MAG: hypothetical protein KGI60_04600 [Patescibacteria group bacterium]|nr:hypothetical protein [Patescibacteria group bacterium]
MEAVAEKKAWLGEAPMTGYDIVALSHDGQEIKVPYGDVHCDGVMVHIVRISTGEDGKREVECIVQVRAESIACVTLRDECRKNRSFKNPAYVFFRLQDELRIKRVGDEFFRKMEVVPFLTKRRR